MIETEYATLHISAARHQRMRLFWRLVESLPQSAVHIVDLGGVGAFWQAFGVEAHPRVNVTVVNLEPHPPICSQVRALIADVFEVERWLDTPVDIVFSNSLIEHLGTPETQQQFAQHICHNAANYFIQTPNYYFPIEPHFMVPAFQYMPLAVQVWLMRDFSLG